MIRSMLLMSVFVGWMVLVGMSWTDSEEVSAAQSEAESAMVSDSLEYHVASQWDSRLDYAW